MTDPTDLRPPRSDVDQLAWLVVTAAWRAGRLIAVLADDPAAAARAADALGIPRRAWLDGANDRKVRGVARGHLVVLDIREHGLPPIANTLAQPGPATAINALWSRDPLWIAMPGGVRRG